MIAFKYTHCRGPFDVSQDVPHWRAEQYFNAKVTEGKWLAWVAGKLDVAVDTEMLEHWKTNTNLNVRSSLSQTTRAHSNHSREHSRTSSEPTDGWTSG